MSIPHLIRQYLEKIHKQTIDGFASVVGGSINEAYRYKAGSKEFFVKCNADLGGIIEKEVEGLNAIASLGCIATPQIIAFEKIGEYEVLVLPYISQGQQSSKAWESFGYQLANMHAKSSSNYGWDHDNFIGSLPQTNDKTSSYTDFFINQRLIPQIQLAGKQNYLSASETAQFEMLFNRLDEIIPKNQPSLVHGDLWSGNFIIDEQGIPYLIDPSVHYSFRETDIAFTHLFDASILFFMKLTKSNIH